MVALAEQLSSGLKAKREIRSFLRAEKDAVRWEYGIDEVWNFYGGRVKDYELTFLKVLSTLQVGTFRDFLVGRAENGLSTNVLDLMGGDASFLRDLKFPANRQDNPSPFDAGLCVTLIDGRGERLKAADLLKFKIEVLCGDLTSKRTWELIDEKQREMRIDTFDLIVCRGCDGVTEKFVPRVLYPFLFGKVWSRLSNNNGLFVTQLPETVSSKELLGQLEQIPGVRVDYQSPIKSSEYYSSLGIVKTRTAPTSLT